MKKRVLILFLFPLLAFSQEKVAQLNYLNHLIDIPENCTAYSEFEVDCENFFAQWLYLDEEMYNQNLHKELINQFQNEFNAIKIGEVELYSFEDKLKAEKYTIEPQKKPIYKVFAYGKISNQYLLLNLTVEKDIKYLPELAKKIIEFK